jgi:hypothetical protein
LGDLEPAYQDPVVILVGEVDDLDRGRVPAERFERLFDVQRSLVRGVE